MVQDFLHARILNFCTCRILGETWYSLWSSVFPARSAKASSSWCNLALFYVDVIGLAACSRCEALVPEQCEPTQ